MPPTDGPAGPGAPPGLHCGPRTAELHVRIEGTLEPEMLVLAALERAAAERLRLVARAGEEGGPAR